MAARWDIPWRYGSPSGSRQYTQSSSRSLPRSGPPSPKKPRRGKVRARSTSINRVCLNSSWMLPLIRSTAAIRSSSYSSAVGCSAARVDSSRGHASHRSSGGMPRSHSFRSSAAPAAAAAPADDAAADGERGVGEVRPPSVGGTHVRRDDAAQLPLRRHAPPAASAAPPATSPAAPPAAGCACHHPLSGPADRRAAERA